MTAFSSSLDRVHQVEAIHRETIYRTNHDVMCPGLPFYL